MSTVSLCSLCSSFTAGISPNLRCKYRTRVLTFVSKWQTVVNKAVALLFLQAVLSDEDDVTYTTVTIKPRNPDHTDNDKASWWVYCPNIWNYSYEHVLLLIYCQLVSVQSKIPQNNIYFPYVKSYRRNTYVTFTKGKSFWDQFIKIFPQILETLFLQHLCANVCTPFRVNF